MIFIIDLIRITWVNCIASLLLVCYLQFVLHLADKSNPYLQLYDVSFDAISVWKDRDEKSHNIELSLKESVAFINYLVYQYKASLEALAGGRRKAYKYKFHSQGRNKDAFKHIQNRIKDKEMITEMDIVELIKMNVIPLAKRGEKTRNPSG